MQLHCPLLRRHLWNAHSCNVNQLFGENPNSLFYGPQGHLGLDLQTVGSWEYEPMNQKVDNYGKRSGNWKNIGRPEKQQLGFIPIVAAHDGWLTTNVFTQDERNGWGMRIEARDNDMTAYRTSYWHIESPWKSLQIFTERLALQFAPKHVTAGSIIAIAGNSGAPRYSTGPHLHFQFEILKDNVWVPTDPIKYLMDNETVYHRYYGPGHHEYFYMGQQLTELRAKEIINSFPKVL